MRVLRLAFVCAATLAAAVGCEAIAGLKDHELASPCDDGGCLDAAPPFEAATNASYSMSIAPPSIVLEPAGSSVPVAITLVRTGGFSEAVAISVSNAPAGISGSAIIPGNASTGTLNVFADKTTTPGQVVQVTVAAQSTPSGLVATQPLTVRIGHLLLATDQSTTFVVPDDVQNATITAWGAGAGGGGTALNTNQPGAAGGAGGFAEATFPVTPGETLSLLVATPGGPGVNTSTYGRGGGGGGYTAVVRGDIPDGGVVTVPDGGTNPFLIVAGGGGGGGGGFYGFQTYYGPGKPGGAGSGADAADGSGAGGGKGATTTAAGAGGATCGNAPSGAFLQGGNWTKGGDAGAPGGGVGGTNSGGGGGGGYWGGGAGSVAAPATCLGGSGGGGGSGYVDATGTGVSTAAGTGATAPNAGHKYYKAGTAAGGAAGAPGAGGYIAISVP